MPSRDVWSHGSGSALRDLLSSGLAALLMAPSDAQPAYFSSPWMSDFPLLPNEYGDFLSLFPDFAEDKSIRFSDYLRRLSQKRPVRIVTVRNPSSDYFAKSPALQGTCDVQFRYAPEAYHEKGILAPAFYVEGSMNITYSGIYVRGEKITYHSGAETAVKAKIGKAYLEFNRRWDQLAKDA